MKSSLSGSSSVLSQRNPNGFSTIAVKCISPPGFVRKESSYLQTLMQNREKRTESVSNPIIDELPVNPGQNQTIVKPRKTNGFTRPYPRQQIIWLSYFIVQEVYIVLYSVMNTSETSWQNQLIIQGLNLVISLANIILCYYILSSDLGDKVLSDVEACKISLIDNPSDM